MSIGRIIRIYDIGKKKLLRKCENKVYRFPFVSFNSRFVP